jgi:hypothetical protein
MHELKKQLISAAKQFNVPEWKLNDILKFISLHFPYKSEDEILSEFKKFFQYNAEPLYFFLYLVPDERMIKIFQLSPTEVHVWVMLIWHSSGNLIQKANDLSLHLSLQQLKNISKAYYLAFSNLGKRVVLKNYELFKNLKDSRERGLLIRDLVNLHIVLGKKSF